MVMVAAVLNDEIGYEGRFAAGPRHVGHSVPFCVSCCCCAANDAAAAAATADTRSIVLACCCASSVSSVSSSSAHRWRFPVEQIPVRIVRHPRHVRRIRSVSRTYLIKDRLRLVTAAAASASFMFRKPKRRHLAHYALHISRIHFWIGYSSSSSSSSLSPLQQLQMPNSRQRIARTVHYVRCIVRITLQQTELQQPTTTMSASRCIARRTDGHHCSNTVS